MLDTTLAILAGGESSRMGTSKAELDVRGQPILDFLLDRFNWPGPKMLIGAHGSNLPRGADRFTRKVFDPSPGQGPLRGILTALEHATTPTVVVAAVDMPGLKREHLLWVSQQLIDRADAMGVMIRRDERWIEPFPSAFRVSAAQTIEKHLATQRRSVHALTQEPHFNLIAPPKDWPAETWLNLNSPADLERFLTGHRK